MGDKSCRQCHHAGDGLKGALLKGLGALSSISFNNSVSLNKMLFYSSSFYSVPKYM